MLACAVAATIGFQRVEGGAAAQRRRFVTVNITLYCFFCVHAGCVDVGVIVDGISDFTECIENTRGRVNHIANRSVGEVVGGRKSGGIASGTSQSSGRAASNSGIALSARPLQSGCWLRQVVSSSCWVCLRLRTVEMSGECSVCSCELRAAASSETVAVRSGTLVGIEDPSAIKRRIVGARVAAWSA